MSNVAKSIATEIKRCNEQEHISEHIERELLNYSTVDLVSLCQEVQGIKQVFTDPEIFLNQDFDDILKELARSALTFMVLQEI